MWPSVAAKTKFSPEDSLVESRGGGQADFDGVEMLKNAVLLRSGTELLVRHFAVQEIAAMALVTDHQVILVDWRCELCWKLGDGVKKAA